MRSRPFSLRRMFRGWVFTVSMTILAGNVSEGALPRLKLVPVAENAFASPVGIANAGDGSGRVFVVDQRGTVHIVTAEGQLLSDPFLDVSEKLVTERSGFDERGLLSIAFHPDFASGEAEGSGRFYVYYSAPSDNAPGTGDEPVDHRSVISEFLVSEDDPDAADPGSERILLAFDQPQFNHDGGQLEFGSDGLLYISTGDGGGADDNEAGHTGGTPDKPDGILGNAQDLTNLLGKILRIDPLGDSEPGGAYGIPGDNPFTGDAEARDEIYAYGLRNSWRFSFDRETGRLFAADVGQGDIEEINIIEAGKNYGWRKFEGAFDFDPAAPTTGDVFESPIAQYAHPGSEIPGLLNIGTSVTGGYVYRGTLIPELTGTYVFGDWTASLSVPSGTLLALEPDGEDGFELSVLEIESGNPVNFFVPAFGEDEDGEIYVAGKTTLAPSAADPIAGLPTGSLYRLAIAVPGAPLPAVRLEPVAEGEFLSPVGITHAGDGSGRLFVIDQRGTVHIIDAEGDVLPDPFLDISGRLVNERPGFDERGLLSLAFHPDFASAEAPGSGRFYVYYSAPSDNAPGTDEDPIDHQSVISEFTVAGGDPDAADPGSERILLTFDQPQFNHDGGQLDFGPDGLLYVSTGDGGGADDNDAGHTGGSPDKPVGILGNAQDLSNLLGKILRIDPLGDSAPGGAYGIPGDNPFTGDAVARDEIFAYGLRNPWRFSFDRETGQLFAADIGQGEIEEINIIEAGKNYGWRRFEGTFDFDPEAPTTGESFEPPVAQYGHPGTDLPGVAKIGISVTGGYVYRGSQSPGLPGAYIFGDGSNSFGVPGGTLLALVPGEIPDTFVLGALEVEGGNPIGLFVPAFGEDEEGEIYVAGKATLAPSAGDPATGAPTGSVFRIVEIAGSSGVSDSVILNPSADNSIFEDGELSNGGGRYLFSGHTNRANDGLERRSLLKFDIAGSVPSGAVIDAATLSINMNKGPRSGAVNTAFGLHPVLQDWGEGTENAGGQEGVGVEATAGSATWTSTALDEGPDWAMAGGDFEPEPSASVLITTSRRRYEWAAPDLLADVQRWLDDSSSNFGWMLVSESTEAASARRFDSREATRAANRPELAIEFNVAAMAPSYRETWLETFFPGGTFSDDFGDEDIDRVINLFEYAFGTDPASPDDPSNLFAFDQDPETGGFSVSFVRDPRAVDLTYTLEASFGLEDWSAVGVSAGGFPVAGSAASQVSESNIVGNHPLKRVRVTLVNSPADTPRLYFRLRITRTP